MQALVTGGFTQTGQFAATPVTQSAVYYGTGFDDVAADVAALLGIPAAQVSPAPGVVGVQAYLGTDFTSGATYGAGAAPSPCRRTSSTRPQATAVASRRIHT